MKREWKEIEYFDSTFDKRTKALLDFLQENSTGYKYKSMLDVGCGKMFAQDYYAKKNGIMYQGLDYIKRSEDTIVCDLNRLQFPKEQYDLILIAGCLEYVENVEWFWNEITRSCKKTIALSYCSFEMNSDLGAREYNAWKNNLYKQDIIEAMAQRRFSLIDSDVYNGKTVFFIFHKDNIIMR